MTDQDILQENWQVILSALPENWKVLGEETKALNYMREFSSPEVLLRTLLLHIAKGYSLRETAVKASLYKLASVSDVALLKRLKKSERWFKELCCALLAENGISFSECLFNVNLRIVDGTSVKEPGKTGSEWRFIYTLRLPKLDCDFFDLSPANEKGGGESFTRLKVNSGDYIIGDRGYASIDGIEHISHCNGYVLVRTSSHKPPLYKKDGNTFDKLQAFSTLKEAGEFNTWEVAVKDKEKKLIKGRLVVVKKSALEIERAHKRLHRIASKKGTKTRPETFEFAKYVALFTTFPKNIFEDQMILKLYRLRWQIELIFKRLKTLVQIGHLPKSDDSSSRAWLYGKLFVSLLTEKLTRMCRDFSPWGYDIEKIYS